MKNPLKDRRAGVLLHPTSLPGLRGQGNIGREARRFIDFLQSAEISVWQMLPLGPTHADHSPYQCMSVHAGNPLLICLDDLAEKGWLPAETAFDAPFHDCLKLAKSGFEKVAGESEKAAFTQFRKTHAFWLDAYSLYQAIRQQQDYLPWYQWPKALRDWQQARSVRDEYALLIDQICFEQYLFFSQWSALHRYANERGVALFGDMPIYVAHDSADVWSNTALFSVNDTGALEAVAGVPPDYFSATGQRWGNPLYRWDILEKQDYGWWVDRFRTQLELFDLLRLDHFRGFEKYWEVPASADTAIDGHWIEGPGARLFDRLHQVFGDLPLVAEDLGTITPEVDALRLTFGFPGMKILQFAFDGGEDNPYLPHNHERLSVVYTGTHDNDTTLGWFDSLDEKGKERVNRHLAGYRSKMPWKLIEVALDSVATLAVFPMQDLLSLGSAERMNTPGTTGSNWCWRFSWSQVRPELTTQLRELIEHYDRNPAREQAPDHNQIMWPVSNGCDNNG
ncbi:MAG: 4-alpha-glucanotransferase [Pseudomonadota bacterium]